MLSNFRTRCIPDLALYAVRSVHKLDSPFHLELHLSKCQYLMQTAFQSRSFYMITKNYVSLMLI